MAYAFNQINNLLGESEQQKANIFGDQMAAGQNQASGQIGDQGQVKTDTSAAGTGAAGGGSSEQAVAGPTDTKTSDKAAIQANVGKVKEPKALGDVRSQVSSANQALQDEANQYLTGAKSKQNYAQTADDYEKAISASDPNASERQKTAQLLNRKTIDPVDAYKQTVDTNIEDASLLNTDAGLRNLASRGMGPRYSAGESAFDVMALRKTPGFDNIVRMIQGENQNLNKTAQDFQTSKQKEVEDYGTGQLTSAQKAAREYLGGQQSAIDTQNEKEAAEYNQKLAEAKKAGLSPEETQKYVEAAKKAALTDRLGTVGDKINVNANDYVNWGSDLGRDAFVDSSEAQRFNSIMGLLGQGGRSLSAAQPVGPMYSVDETRLQNDVRKQGEAARGAADAKLQARINEIMGAAGGAAQAENQKRASAKDQAMQEAIKIAEQEGARGAGVDWSPYVTYGSTDLGAQDFLNQGQADELNRIYGELGDPRKAGAGSIYANPYQNKAFDFNEMAYREALQNALRQMSQAAPAPAAPTNNNTSEQTIIDQFKQGGGAISDVPRSLGRAVRKGFR